MRLFQSEILILSILLFCKSITAQDDDECPPVGDEEPDCSVFRPHPNPTAPEWFYQCLDGETLCFKCPNDMVFNPEDEVCEIIDDE